MCGEQTVRMLRGLGKEGSPPRVRGTVVVLTGVAPAKGITPACAGNRHFLNCAPGAAKDHPRVCGEQVPPPVMVWLVLGSPPRVRGTVRLWALQVGNARITPACAGNRRSRPPLKPPWRDHPRVCGEQLELWTNW